MHRGVEFLFSFYSAQMVYLFLSTFHLLFSMGSHLYYILEVFGGTFTRQDKNKPEVSTSQKSMG